jgi:putative Ig domain-containing protein
VSYLSSGRIVKPTVIGEAASVPTGKLGAIFQDDNGSPDLSKIQMVGWTLIALAAYLINVAHQIHQIHHNPGADLSLPDIDAALMVLMGLAQGTYVGKKLVSTNPTLAITTPKKLSPAAVGKEHIYTLDATGGVPPYHWALAQGALPTDFTLDEAGKLTGTPQTTSSTTFTLQVTDEGDSPPAREEFTLEVV